ncbi:uracil-DNA glycosylase family protein [Daejeonella oryzae]|uniref:hypothetical protein n=1 Tax=Daejeonella oryzae TaxID=1122943 RepID=UPI0004051328|nr:hypothetical protein [Daejeonella oryzae]
MSIIQHKFRDYQVNPETEILILGTFTPENAEGPDFFYGRERNFLWHLLPICYGLPDLKEAPLAEKKAFMEEYKVDFADFILSLNVPEGSEQNVDDSFIDSHVDQWKNIGEVIDSLPKLKAVYFTRKTFNGIPNTRAHLALISDKCRERKIRLCKLETPAKFFSPEKQQQWIDTIVLKNTCLKP